MHISNKYLISALLLIIITPVQADNNLTIEDESSIQGTQLSINLSAAKRFRKADAELNSLFKKLINSEEHPGRKSRLRDAQRAWINFRDTSCIYEAGPYGEGGSIGEMDYANCMHHHTETRIKDLKRYFEDYIN